MTQIFTFTVMLFASYNINISSIICYASNSIILYTYTIVSKKSALKQIYKTDRFNNVILPRNNMTCLLMAWWVYNILIFRKNG